MASEPFAEAAETQARALGLEVARVFVAHPIQDRTDDEMRSLADEALDALTRALTSAAAPRSDRQAPSDPPTAASVTRRCQRP